MVTHTKPLTSTLGSLAAVVFVVGVVGVAGVGVTTAQSPQPDRIISLVPAVTEMLFAIGAGPQVVGIGSFDQLPDGHESIDDLVRVGGLLDPDMEQIFTLRPDLVVLYRSQTDPRQQLERARIPILEYQHGGLEEISGAIRTLGARTGHTREAETIATRLEAGLAAIRARVADRPRPRTLLVFGREPLTLRNVYASGGVGFLHDMLEIAGGENVFQDVEGENLAQVSAEAILSAAPDVIVEIRYIGNIREDSIDEERAVWQRLSALPATRSGRIHFLTGNRFVVPGPRVVEATEALARLLHPEAF